MMGPLYILLSLGNRAVGLSGCHGTFRGVPVLSRKLMATCTVPFLGITDKILSVIPGNGINIISIPLYHHHEY